MTNITELLDGHDPAVMFECAYGQDLIKACENDPELIKLKETILYALEKERTQSALETHFYRRCDEEGYDSNYDEVKLSFLIHSASSCRNVRYPLFLYMHMHDENHSLLSFDNEDIYPVLIGRLGLSLVGGGPYHDIGVIRIVL